MSRIMTLRCGGCGIPLAFQIETWADPPERAYCDEACRHRTRGHARQGAARV